MLTGWITGFRDFGLSGWKTSDAITEMGKTGRSGFWQRESKAGCRDKTEAQAQRPWSIEGKEQTARPERT